MLWERLELLSHLGAGAGCVLYGLSLRRRQERLKIHTRLGLFLVVLGFSITTRSVFWTLDNAFFAHMMLFGFGLFPLLLSLFFEALLRRSLHIQAKLILLASTFFFCGTFWTQSAIHTRWWGLSLFATHIITVLYLGSLTFFAWRKSKSGPMKSLYAATLVVCALSPILMTSDWLFLFDIDIPQLGAIPAVLILYFSSYSFHAVGEWRLRAGVYRLFYATITIFFVAIILSILHQQLQWSSLFGTFYALVMIYLVAESVRRSFRHGHAQRTGLLFERLYSVPIQNLNNFLSTLQKWPELQKIVYIEGAEFSQKERSRMLRYFDANGSTAEDVVLQNQLLLSNVHDHLLGMEQLLHLMSTHQVKHLLKIGNKGEMLGVSFVVGLEQATYKHFLSVIVMLCQLLYQKHSHSKRLTTKDFSLFKSEQA